MSVKTITIREEAYKALLEEKRENESFSDTILRLAKSYRKKGIKELEKIFWSVDLSKDEKELLMKIIREKRKERR